MDRFFEKISFDQYCKDINSDINAYNNYQLPARSTLNSAGYDFRVITDVEILAGESVMISTGTKVKMKSDEVLLIIIRSSAALKNKLSLLNQTGVIDSDYYSNIGNEGHIYIPIQNNGKEAHIIKQGENFAQGIFTKFLTIDNEKNKNNSRIGGFGSTNKGDVEHE